MMAESGSIDSVEYVTYNYSVKRPELFICMLHFPDPPIRSDPICPSNRIGSVSQEWEIGSVATLGIINASLVAGLSFLMYVPLAAFVFGQERSQTGTTDF